jgi:hypothetical protein
VGRLGHGSLFHAWCCGQKTLKTWKGRVLGQVPFNIDVHREKIKHLLAFYS